MYACNVTIRSVQLLHSCTIHCNLHEWDLHISLNMSKKIIMEYIELVFSIFIVLVATSLSHNMWFFYLWLCLLVNKLHIAFLPQNNLYLPTMSIAFAIFSNSSGQISGQWVNPKYNKIHFPRKSLSVTAFPFWSVRLNGPPSATFPIDLFFAFSFS